MCGIMCISNRRLCRGDFTRRIRRILDCGVTVVLREKDLDENEYYDLLREINRHDIIAHTFAGAAKKFGCRRIHMPLHLIESAAGFDTIGVSVHSPDEAKKAAAFGAAYVTAGHVFETDCKKGLAPRGVKLISDIKSVTDIAVYGLGGITPDNAWDVTDAGADGIAVMSGFMQCGNVDSYIDKLRGVLAI